MIKLFSFILLTFLSVKSAAQSARNIIPLPHKIEMRTGTFYLDKNTSVQYEKGQENLKRLDSFLRTQLKNRFGIQVSNSNKHSSAIILSIDKTLTRQGSEGYVLKITPDQIEITAPDSKGIFYGIQSLLQCIPQETNQTSAKISCVYMEDQPRFAWRGMMLDVVRHFFTVDDVKNFLDIMSTYKMNVFHWHLVDDQGWRLQINKYPKLTSVGAWRMETPGAVYYAKNDSLTGTPTRYGGFYTQQEAREIVQYAVDRNILVIPEIEMPGHSQAALAAYPQFSCENIPQEVASSASDFAKLYSNYCPSNDSTFIFLQDVLDEVMDIFPSPYIHIGGDEVDKRDWKKHAKDQELIKEKNLKDENGLQSYFIHRIADYLKAHGKNIIGWDETLDGGLSPNALVQSWRGTKGGIAAAKQKHGAIMSPSNPLYFNRYQGDPETEPFAAKFSINTLKKVYEYDPVPVELDSTETKFIIGVEGAIWVEFIRTYPQVQYMLLPRMLALSEVAWSPNAHKDWNHFLEKIPYHFNLFTREGWNFDKKDIKFEEKK